MSHDAHHPFSSNGAGHGERPAGRPGRIVVGVDGSEPSAHALAWALDQAAKGGEDVEVVQAWDITALGPPYGAEAFDDVDYAAAAKASAELAVARVRAFGFGDGVPIACCARPGAPAGVLIERAAGADFVVVGRDGIGIGALIVGSVSIQVASHCSRPVVVVPHAAHVPSPSPSVVVGVDGSTGADGALRWAADLAARNEAPLVVVNAYRSWPVMTWLGPQAFVDDHEARARSEELLRDAVDRVLTGHRPRPADVECRAVRGEAGRVLPQVAGPSAVLVVGSRGIGGFRGLLLGSVGRHAIHASAGPVAVVPSPGRG